MKKSEQIRSKPSIQLMQERYEYWSRVPYPGLVIDHRPAITQVDISQFGDYLIYLVRDPLGAYGKDPAERMAEKLERADGRQTLQTDVDHTGPLAVELREGDQQHGNGQTDRCQQ